MENSPNCNSIRKQFLTKIYKRSSEKSQDSSFVDDYSASINANSSFSSQKSDTGQNRNSPTRLDRRSGTPGIKSRRNNSVASNKDSMSIFVEFLSEILHSQGQITANTLNKVYSVTKALNDNFAKNPEFSLQFYISMSEILNALNDLESVNFDDLQNKVEFSLSLTQDGITEMEQLTCLKRHIAKINLKVITSLKRHLTAKEEIQQLSHAYLIFFSNADKDIELSPNKKIPATSVLPVMQKYTLMPGKMIQTCRKVVEFIHKKQILAISAKSAQETLNKINQQSLMETDRSGGMLILYDFLKACIIYYYAYNQQNPKRSSSPVSHFTPEQKIVEVEESDLDLNSSRKKLNSTPVKMKLKPVLENKISSLSKSESTRSLSAKDGFEGVLEEKFRKFLRGYKMIDLGKIVNRLTIVDEFEKEVRVELREMFLEKFMDEKSLRLELDRVSLE